MFSASRIYGLDIETDTTIDGLDPRVAAITEISVSTGDDDYVFSGDEASILAATNDLLYTLPPGLIVTWNGSFFDLPFISDRAARHPEVRSQFNLELYLDPGLVSKYPPLPGHPGGYAGVWHCHDGAHQHLDIARAYKAYADEHAITWRLKPVAQALGIDMVEVDREKMHELAEAERRRYVASDTRGTRELAIRLLGSS